MAVLLTPFFLQFVDDNGVPVAGGKVYTYSAGTTTPKATFTDFSEVTQAANPIILDSAGRATVWISGSYKFVLQDALGNTIRTTDNVIAFSTPDPAASAFFQSLSGDGATTVFTVSTNLGTDEKALLIYVNNGGWIPQNPNQFTISGTSLTFVSAPPNAANNVYVFAPSLLLGAAATSATDAATSATAAAASAVLASQWATLTTGLVAATDDSAKAYAIGGTGVTATAGKGAAKEWATKTSAAVDTTEFSAKEYAQGAQAATGGSAKNWAKQTGADVTGASANDRSAKSWAQEAITGATLGGSAKDWAQSASLPDGTNKSAKSYAADASTSATAAASSATSASGSASTATTQASNASTSATAAASSATAAAASATSASSSASTATTQASNASTSAANALTSENNAEQSEDNAGVSETNAATSAANAATSETNAATSATAAAASATSAASIAAGVSATSTTSLLIAVASKTFTTQSGKQFQAGMFISAVSAANNSNYMHGQVTSYSGTSLVVNVLDIGGSGTLADWNIAVSGSQGPMGATGANGSVPVSAAAGSADAITATFSPPLTLADKTVCMVIAASANATATPTFAPDGLTVHTIKKNAAAALVSGDIAGSGHAILLEYNLAGTYWTLLNPAWVAPIPLSYLDTDTALANNSDTKVATQKAVKAYVDTAVLGLDFKPAVRVATTAALTVTYVAGVLTNAGSLAALVIDGVSMAIGDRVLVKNQASALQNGWYSVTTVGSGAIAWVMTRTSESDATGEIVEGDCSLTEEGTSNAGTLWFVTTSGTITIGTTGISYTQLAITSVAANALTGTTLSASVVTSSLTAVGTIATGVWSSTAIVETKGGTNQTTYASGDILYASASNTLSKLAVNSTATKKYLQTVSSGAPSWQQIADADMAFTDVATGNASTSNHGFLKKLDNTATHYMDGTGAWSTPAAAAQEWVLLDTQTASGSASLNSTTGWNSSAYSMIKIVFTDIRPANASVDLWLRTSGDGSTFDSGASSYAYAQTIQAMKNGSTAQASATDTKIIITGASNVLTNGTNDGASGEITFINVQSVTRPKHISADVTYNTGTTSYTKAMTGAVRSTLTTAILGAQLLCSAGSITSGVMYVYGLKNT